MVYAYVGGIAPRSVEYMRSHWDHAKAFITDDELSERRAEEERAWQRAQADVRLSFLAPALTSWEDLLRPIAPGPGEQAGPLTRVFETNTFYRAPVVEAPFPDPASWYADIPLPDGPWICTLPSPYDLIVRASTVADGAALELAAHLNAVARWAIEHGAHRVRWQEPSALYHGYQPDVGLFSRLLAVATSGIEDRSILHLYQGDAAGRPEVIAANPCIGLSIEPPSGPVEVRGGTEVSAAVLRGDSSQIEDPATLLAQAEAVATAAGEPLWGITNAWDLDHVPHALGLRKLSALGATITAPAAVEVAA